MGEEDEAEYEVEAILDFKKTSKGDYYLIKWKGYEESENSWQPETNLDCDELIEQFWEERRIDRFTIIGVRDASHKVQYFANDKRYGLFTINETNKQNYLDFIVNFWENGFIESQEKRK